MSEEQINVKQIIEQFVDYLMPELTPRESSMYIFLLRNSYLRNGENKIRKGQKTLAKLYGRGVKSPAVDSRHLMKSTVGLEQKG